MEQAGPDFPWTPGAPVAATATPARVHTRRAAVLVPSVDGA
jgi:hypothetical protein